MIRLSKEKRSRLMMVGMGTLAVIVGVWQTMVVAQQASLKDVARRLAEQRGRIDNAERVLNARAQLQKDLEAAKETLRVAESEMASGDKYSWFIETVSTFRTNYQVDIPQFSRETPCEVGMVPQFPYKAVQFVLKGTAHFHDFGNFLRDFENRFPHLRVQRLELEPAGVSSANATSHGADDTEKLAFKMEIVALVNPNSR